MVIRTKKGLLPQFDRRKVYIAQARPVIRRAVGVVPASINLVGFDHGDGPIPIALRIKRLIRQELLREKGLVFSEFEKKFSKKDSIHVDDSSTKNIILRTFYNNSKIGKLLKFIGAYIVKGWVHNAVDIWRPASKKSIFPGRLHESDADVQELLSDIAGILRKNSRFSNTDVRDGVRLMVTGRSALMAAEVFRRMSRGDKPSATVLMGYGHLEEMRTFFENPRMGMRYCSLISSQLKRSRRSLVNSRKISGSDVDEMINEFDRASNIFNQQILN